MLEMANAGQLNNLPEPVVVIGGGNTAIDAAVTARHLGAKEVYLIYRRGFAQMPAWPDERHRAVDLGIHVLILVRPIAYMRDTKGALLGVRCTRTRLQADNTGGRDIPADAPDSEIVLPASCVIEAIGQRPDELTRSTLACLRWTNGTLAVNADTQETSLPGVFAGGDLVNGGKTVVEAIAQALLAAEHITGYVQRHRTH
jgi:glutamate synthase (NADPH/NADH) small chain